MSFKFLKLSTSSFRVLNPPPTQFHNGIDFSHGIDSVESMPKILRSLKFGSWLQSQNPPRQ
jgi:hypothetical protein